MKLSLIGFGVLGFLPLPLIGLSNHSSREHLNECVMGLQQNPSDYALREKSIYLAKVLQPLPAVPEEARQSEPDKTREAQAVLTHVASTAGDDEFYEYIGSVVDPNNTQNFQGGAIEEGLTIAELADGYHWWKSGQHSDKYVIKSGQIYLCPFRKYNGSEDEWDTVVPDPENADYIGSPNGPGPADIIWKAKSGKRVWARLDEDSGQLIIGPERPIENPDPNVKYAYYMYRRASSNP